jgi:hypothetical protein
MSFAGAIVGSGTLEKMMAKPDVADVRPLFQDDVLTYTDALKDNLGSTSSALHSTFALIGLDDANDPKQTQMRRSIAWVYMFDSAVAPWGKSGAIASQTLADLNLLWNSFEKWYNAVVLSIYGYPRYEGARLRDKVLEGYLLALVVSGVANRSPSVKRTRPTEAHLEGDEWVFELQDLRYTFPGGGEVTVRAGDPRYKDLNAGFKENTL